MRILFQNSIILKMTLTFREFPCYSLLFLSFTRIYNTCLPESNAYVDEKGCSLIFYGLETNPHFMGIDDIFSD